MGAGREGAGEAKETPVWTSIFSVLSRKGMRGSMVGEGQGRGTVVFKFGPLGG